jgi:hypothetical protein
MSKLKPTQRGKAGKHKSQDTYSDVYLRGLRKARVKTPLDCLMMERIFRGSADEVDGALAGSQGVRLSNNH